MIKNYFIIHDSFGGHWGNWLPWRIGKIEKTKPEDKEEPIVYIPQVPTGVGDTIQMCLINVKAYYLELITKSPISKQFLLVGDFFMSYFTKFWFVAKIHFLFIDFMI